MIARVAIVGAGRVGTTLTRALVEAQYDVVSVMSRTLGSAQKAVNTANENNSTAVDKIADIAASDIVFLTVPDELIKATAREIMESAVDTKAICHCSGAKSSAELQFAADAGMRVASMHPLQSFADPGTAMANLPGTYWALEGVEGLTDELQTMIQRLQGICLPIKRDQKVAYHAGAVLACNYLYTLESIATKVMSQSGIPPEDCLKALMPLLQGTLNNMGSVGLPQALSGPISRGDIHTVEQHLSNLSSISSPERAREVYSLMGMEAIDMATKQITGIDSDTAERLRSLLDPQKKYSNQ
ncbi:hypothetical protein SARC_02088 [Sphaeroforma arctica JP610]|uniref:DUF2520 domain-containing protein n=1 Tax=Sphaeroforma arctica JP610 TaxID=667725 RepID=A0A0L0GA11_9EUKA|nr:hypothetical protein SARC_02088 [Sphaeroforma arctica JP610]KNC85749.1 hypothetical protein SARC_02088 [Sphaeroforma arctica JP610]|eukprot:XP_014159651.1 hypothetical protein SARC_02088 [Sphaeroforma arctica JP610]